MINASFRIALLTVALGIISCGKTTSVEGTVFSKHNIPVPNVRVYVQLYKGSDYSDHAISSVLTDQSGKYKISFKFRNHRRYNMFCNSDSGSYNSPFLVKGQNQTMDMPLN